ncbi:unnamed protein product [Macrosiphum euphorbiae]|uniref:Uncharacterized protein n=1 Tax=Macrosiphum euphorbiae TaxID=13131 RepID=A0AAV0VZ80_9HEMI|nr:unnamed protein product [Macrosiphum euphorbiae]
MADQLNEILESLKEIKSTQTKLVNAVNDQSRTLKSFNKRFDDLNEKLEKLSNDNIEMNNRVSDLENKFKTLHQSNLTTHNNSDHDIINEILDRQSRANNILLFNFPEKLSESTSLDTDSDRLKIIFSKLNLKFEPIKLHRLGIKSKYDRPLKITLSDPKQTFDVLRTQSTLRTLPEFKDLRFSSDRTFKQRETMAKLRQELVQRREKGENDIIIKYVRGNPTIIKSKNI